MKKYVVVLISYMLITFIWAYLFNEIIFKGEFAAMASFTRAEPIFPLGFAVMIIESVVIYILYSKFYLGIQPFRESFTLIFLVGSFNILVFAMIVPAVFEIYPVWKYAVLRLLYGLVHYTMVGTALALIFGKKNTHGSVDKRFKESVITPLYKQIGFLCDVTATGLDRAVVTPHVRRFLKGDAKPEKAAKPFMKLCPTFSISIDRASPLGLSHLKQRGLTGMLMGPRNLDNNPQLLGYILDHIGPN